MPRKNKEELKLSRRDKRLDEIISSNKFLRESKYFKNNSWSWAAWDSWAARGQAGGCYGCSNNFYNATLRNKRAATKIGGRENICKEVSGNFCFTCVQEIEKKRGIEFKIN